jgi:Domain of unknown function (DUF3471)
MTPKTVAPIIDKSTNTGTSASYAGTYQIAAGFAVKIRVAGGHLVAQAGEQPEVEPVPASDIEFYVLEGPVKIVFETDAAGRAVSPKAWQNGQQFAAKKID